MICYSIIQNLLFFKSMVIMDTAALSCAWCSLFESNNGNGIRFLNMNEAKSHARIHIAQLKMLQDGEIDEEQIFDQCFPKSPRMGQEVSFQCRQSLIDLCRSLFRKSRELISIDCNLCGCGIKIVDRSSLNMDNIINHAKIHAGVKPFKCGRCENTFRKRGDVQAHIKRVHGTKMTNNDFEDQSEKFHDEISNSIKHCFTECKEGAPSKEIREKTREEIAVLSSRLKNRSELAVQRQVSFTRMIKKAANLDGEVKCHLCSKTIVVISSVKSRGSMLSTVLAFRHAQSHLRKPLYRCKVCSVSLNTYLNMQRHLRVKHTLGMEKNFECFADKYHSDILAIFAQCYEQVE